MISLLCYEAFSVPGISSVWRHNQKIILHYRGVFRTQSNIQDGAFCENRLRFKAGNYFHKKLRVKESLFIH